MDINIEQFYKSFPTLDHRRNRFPWKKTVNFNMKMGEITPIAIIPTAPGVTYNLDLSTVMKVAPTVVPPQDTAVAKFFAFGIINRNYWDNYKYWYGEKKNPEDPENENTYLVPKVKLPTSYIINEGEEDEEEVQGFPYNSFYDNIGCNPEFGGYKIDKYIVNGDRDIYNNYFRNQSLENPLPIDRSDADLDPWENMYLRKISKPRDLFSGSLPNASGTTPVEIPLGSEAPVVGNGMALGFSHNKGAILEDGNGGMGIMSPIVGAQNNAYGTTVGTSITNQEDLSYRNTSIGITTDPTKSGIIADLSKAMGAPLEGLYQAIAYNTYQFMVSRGGNRYFEQLANVYGITNPESVLSMAEFLGSTSTRVEFDTVTQTSSTAGQETPLGNRSANGYVEDYGNIVNKSFGEFGWIIIYAVITHYPKYQQGVNKLLQTEDPLDLFNPLFNYIGDEAIYKSEIYAQSDEVVNEDGTPVNDEVWGYNKRHSRWIYPIDEIHGEQRSQYKQSLDTNHFAEYYTEAPVLNKEFDKISDETLKRALTVTDETQFIGNATITGTIDIEIPLESIPSPFPNINIKL